mgnify:CR=1 FL=1
MAQAVPLTANAVGFVLLVPLLARNPKLVLAPAASVPFQLALVTVTAAPDWVSAAFQDWLTCCPSAKVQVNVHPLIAAVPVFATVTSPWNPPPHCPETV